jgi:hypothetical protein
MKPRCEPLQPLPKKNSDRKSFDNNRKQLKKLGIVLVSRVVELFEFFFLNAIRVQS